MIPEGEYTSDKIFCDGKCLKDIDACLASKKLIGESTNMPYYDDTTDFLRIKCEKAERVKVNGVGSQIYCKFTHRPCPIFSNKLDCTLKTEEHGEIAVLILVSPA